MKTELLSSEIINKIARLDIKTSCFVDGSLAGIHRNRHRGESIEFAQHREYAPGDEIRRIDWKAYARNDRYCVKEFEDETNLRAWLCLDQSGSMGYSGEGRPSKMRYAAQLCAALCWLLLDQGDAVGIQCFDERPRTFLAPCAQKAHLWNIIEVLENLQPKGSTSVTAALSQIAERFSGRGLIVLLSDCLDFKGQFTSMARILRKQRQRMVVIQVLDPDELTFPFQELCLFESMENEGEIEADPRGMKQQYLLEMKRFCDDLRLELEDGGVDFAQVQTDWPIEQSLLALFGGRR